MNMPDHLDISQCQWQVPHHVPIGPFCTWIRPIQRQQSQATPFNRRWHWSQLSPSAVRRCEQKMKTTAFKILRVTRQRGLAERRLEPNTWMEDSRRKRLPIRQRLKNELPYFTPLLSSPTTPHHHSNQSLTHQTLLFRQDSHLADNRTLHLLLDTYCQTK